MGHGGSAGRSPRPFPRPALEPRGAAPTRRGQASLGTKKPPVARRFYKSQNGQLRLIDPATENCLPSETAISRGPDRNAGAARAEGRQARARRASLRGLRGRPRLVSRPASASATTSRSCGESLPAMCFARLTVRRRDWAPPCRGAQEASEGMLRPRSRTGRRRRLRAPALRRLGSRRRGRGGSPRSGPPGSGGVRRVPRAR